MILGLEKLSYTVKVLSWWPFTRFVQMSKSRNWRLVMLQSTLSNSSAVTTGGPGPPKIWAWKFFFSRVFALLSHRFNTKTFCKDDVVKKARFSHFRGWKIENFLARRPQPWWGGLLSYNIVYRSIDYGYNTILEWPPNIKSVVTALNSNLRISNLSLVWPNSNSLSNFSKKFL